MGHFRKQTNSHLEKIHIFQNEPIPELGHMHQGIPEDWLPILNLINSFLRNEAKFAQSQWLQRLARYFLNYAKL